MAKGFEHAIVALKQGLLVSREAWKPGKYIAVRPGEGERMSYIELVYTSDGRRAPWTPTRCDLLEQDWEITT